MNRLAADQVSDQISSIRNLNGEQAMVIAIRKMAITQAKLVGSPDAEELVDFLIKEDQTSHASTDEKRQKKASGNSEISELAKDKPKQERLEETEKAKVAKRKANKEVLKSQLTSEEKKRIAREQLIEADKVKEALARQRAFHAGEWKFCPCESDSPAPEPTAREMSISLTSSGSFFSTHDETKAKGVKTTVQISGDWDYDYIRQVLALEGTKKIKTTSEGFLSSLLSSLTNGVQTDPYSSRFTITNSANGIHKAYDSDGEQWSIRKSL
jgi:hypothetical protein